MRTGCTCSSIVRTRPRREFLTSLEEKPSFATVHVRMALMYATLGQLDRALEMVTQGYQADPLLPTLPSAEVNVRVWRREYDKAVVIGSKAVELHPVPARSAGPTTRRRSNSQDAFRTRSRSTSSGAIMSGDLPWMRALEGTCLAKLGRTADARAILDELEHRRETDYADALLRGGPARRAGRACRRVQGNRAGVRRELGVPVLDRRRSQDGHVSRATTASRQCCRTRSRGLDRMLER